MHTGTIPLSFLRDGGTKAHRLGHPPLNMFPGTEFLGGRACVDRITGLLVLVALRHDSDQDVAVRILPTPDPRRPTERAQATGTQMHLREYRVNRVTVAMNRGMVAKHGFLPFEVSGPEFGARG